MSDVEQTVIEIIRAKVEDPVGEIEPVTLLSELGLDSLDAVEFVFEIESAFSIDIPFSHDSDSPEFETVGDVIAAVANAIAHAPKAT